MATAPSRPPDEVPNAALVKGGRAPMTQRQVTAALSGLLLGMLVAILSSTIGSATLPWITADLNGSPSVSSWVVKAPLPAIAASTPLWGKLADLTSKKALVQIALVLFVLSSCGAGLSQNPGMLITFRVLQGIGVGGLSVLAQTIMAAMLAPRERGRYSGYLGAAFVLATVGGPLLGGVIADTSWLGWRWCFYVGVPFAVIALIVLQKTLHLPVVRREGVKTDWLGAFFIAAAACALLLWFVSVGQEYDWMSWQTGAMAGGALVLALAFVLVESKAEEPVIPLRMFRNRTITLASVASLLVGITMLGATVLLSNSPHPPARGESPTMGGLMTIPMIAGLVVSTIVSGEIISRTGKWKRLLITGGVLMTAGMGLLGTLRYDIVNWQMAVIMALFGLGVGMMTQNLVLAAQNQVSAEDLGAAGSTVNLFRSLGGVAGLGALSTALIFRFYLNGEPGGPGYRDRTILTLGVGDSFLYVTPLAFLGLLCVLFIKEVPFRTQSGSEQGAGPQPAFAAPGVPGDATAAVERTVQQPVAQADGAHGGPPRPGPGAQSALGELEPDDPEQLGGYVLAARLGAGGMGRVYLSHTGAGRPVAIKAVRPEVAHDPEFRRRFRREVAAARRVQGLYTAPVIDSQVDGPVLWLATAYVPGPTLAAAVSRHGALPVSSALMLAAGVAEALQEVHGEEIVHRDLKPSNVLLATDGPRVIDFGIARAADATSLTNTGAIVGTPAFMSPEQAVNREVGPASDVFSLGQLITYAATGTPAFGEGSSFGVLYRIVHEEPDLADVPDVLLPLLRRCLAKDPHERPSPAEVIELCRSAIPGRELRRSEDWLPEAITLEAARHQSALSEHTW